MLKRRPAGRARSSCVPAAHQQVTAERRDDFGIELVGGGGIDHSCSIASILMPSSDYLIWIDLEMTGLKPDTDVIIEMATIVTDIDLNVVAEGPVIAIHQPPEVLDAMDEWNKRTHGASGLIDRVRSSGYTMASAEKRTLESLTCWSSRAHRPCVATASARTGASSRATCPRSRSSSTTGTWT